VFTISEKDADGDESEPHVTMGSRRHGHQGRRQLHKRDELERVVIFRRETVGAAVLVVHLMNLIKGFVDVEAIVEEVDEEGGDGHVAKDLQRGHNERRHLCRAEAHAHPLRKMVNAKETCDAKGQMEDDLLLNALLHEVPWRSIAH